tara:strand:- start:190 stop:1029 length:840 start_codon:yes stop_codon:yes gene_type:complete
MADTAYQTQYRQEFIAGFEDMQSRLRSSCITEAVIKGTTATFLVADSGSATAVTRGVNGLIPARPDSLTQTSATLAEWHDLVRKTKFNIFGSQGNARAIMQHTSMGVVNRKIDDDIITQLDTATNDTGAYGQASMSMVVKAKVILGVNYVPTEETDNMFAVVTPAFMGYLEQLPEWGSSDYVDVKIHTGAVVKYRRWAGVNWIEHPRLTGVGTSQEKCYMYHRNAIGHAADKDGLEAPVGYNEEQAYSWCRVSIHMGSKLLQNAGVVQMKHDGSAFASA